MGDAARNERLHNIDGALKAIVSSKFVVYAENSCRTTIDIHRIARNKCILHLHFCIPIYVGRVSGYVNRFEGEVGQRLERVQRLMDSIVARN